MFFRYIRRISLCGLVARKPRSFSIFADVEMDMSGENELSYMRYRSEGRCPSRCQVWMENWHRVDWLVWGQ
jgi:hypothetical protein